MTFFEVILKTAVTSHLMKVTAEQIEDDEDEVLAHHHQQCKEHSLEMLENASRQPNLPSFASLQHPSNIRFSYR